jgi:hypothetical protein
VFDDFERDRKADDNLFIPRSVLVTPFRRADVELRQGYIGVRGGTRDTGADMFDAGLLVEVVCLCADDVLAVAGAMRFKVTVFYLDTDERWGRLYLLIIW